MTREQFYWLNEDSVKFLGHDYLLPGVTAIERIKQIADEFAKRTGNEQDGIDFYNHMAAGYFSLSSPIWANYGIISERRGLPISCFGSYIGDSVDSILDGHKEIGTMSQYGGGTSAYFDLRPRGAKIRGNGTSTGSYSFLPMFNTLVECISQGGVRKGQMAAYIDVEHGDIEEWLKIKSEGDKVQYMYYGVCVGNTWLQEMIDGDDAKRSIWAKILESRKKRGIPYIFFKDNANGPTKPDVYKDEKVLASNLCTEIMLPSSDDESFVCCLSSMNLVHYHEWKDTNAVYILTKFLNTVLDEFCDKTGEVLAFERAYTFAKNHRAIGIGVLGWHSLLQANNIAFEDFEASMLNAEIFALLKKQAYEASEKLLLEYPEWQPVKYPNLNRANTTLLAVAPTKSSSIILGQVSQGIEPYTSNYFPKVSSKGKMSFRNPYLIEVLEKYGKNTSETWMNILDNKGSVQNLDFLTQHEKNVFKTFVEISQLTIIQQAAQRQRFIDQGQSINLTIPEEASVKDINTLHLEAARLGVKSLYYQKSISAARNAQNLLACASCES